MQLSARDAIALDVTGKTGIEHVGEVAVDADACWEGAIRRDHLVELQGITADAEHRNGVAARVGCQEQRVIGVVHQSALRGEGIDGGAGRPCAVSTGGVGPGESQGAVIVASVGDYRIASRVVGLDEDGVVGARRWRRRLSQHRWSAQQGSGQRRDRNRQSDQISHGSSSDSDFDMSRNGRARE